MLSGSRYDNIIILCGAWTFIFSKTHCGLTQLLIPAVCIMPWLYPNRKTRAFKEDRQTD